MVQARQQKSMVRCVAGTTIRIRNKKMPANGGRAQPKIGPRDAESGAVCRVGGTPSAITHIGCVYADEPSIGKEYERTMTHLKGATVCAGTFVDGIGHVA